MGGVIRESSTSDTVSSATAVPSEGSVSVTLPVTFSQTERLESFYENCRNFYLALLLDMFERFDFSDKFFEVAEMLEPTAVRDFEQHRLKSLFDRFPQLHQMCCYSSAEQEWESLSMFETSVFGKQTESEVKSMAIEEFWQIVFQLRTITDSPRFPNLIVCVSLLFSLPASNVSAEREFSQLKEIKTDRRNCLHDITIASLLNVKHWLTRCDKENQDAHTVELPEGMIKSVLKVDASEPISNHPKSSSKAKSK